MSEPTAVSDARIGTVLQQRYRILERLAAGGMGIVYRGERLEVGKAVAIKFLHAWAAQDEDFRKRFQVEARAMSRLTHPCCVSVIDFGVDQDSPYMVMDFVTGETLRGLLRDGALPLGRALAAVRQVLAGLAHAHGQGIIHRDIKPENILVTHAVGLGEQVRILDFGIAKLRDEVTGITAGMMLGTPAYMAPEQIHGEPVGPPADLYATGVLLFELLTGRKPFSAQGTAELLRMHREVPPPRLRDAAPDAGFSAGLEAAVAKALAKAPTERFQSAAEFLSALDVELMAVSETQTTPRPTPATPMGPEAQRSASEALEPAPTASARPVDKAVAKQHAPAPTREIRIRTPAGMRTPEHESSLEAPAAEPASSRHEATERIADAKPAAPGPQARAPFRFGHVTVGGAAVLVLLGAAIVWRGSPPAASLPAQKAPGASKDGAREEAPQQKAASPDVFHPVPEQLPGIDEAHRLIAAQRRDSALALLKKLAVRHPKSAYVRYLEGNVDFDNLRWVDGVAAYRMTLRNDPAYRNAPTLIQNALRCLVSDRYHGLCEDFIRKDLGDAAVPYLEEAARTDPMANVRTRASMLLRERQSR
ncbi:protein kinase [Corallococcus exercitus]|uniref:serine/threonine-protein kinase n=1 Tax=Corallococcus exercitus TaxID=2316736 RepID=UPI0035D4BC94